MKTSTDESARWRRITLCADRRAEDYLSLVLTEEGATGFQTEENDDGTSRLIVYQHPDEAFEPFQDHVIAKMRAFEQSSGRTAGLTWAVDEIVGEDWKEAWKEHFHARQVTPRFVIKPSWENISVPAGVHVIEIDPGQAFGTGLHATTSMCLRWIDEVMGEDRFLRNPPARGLDLGTGTGVLAAAMAKLGVERVLAVDCDPVAVEAAAVNIRLNRVDAQVTVEERDGLESFQDNAFDIVTANLTGPVLKTMSGGLARCAGPGAVLILSGILQTEKESVLDAFGTDRFTLVGEKREEEWLSVLLERRD